MQHHTIALNSKSLTGRRFELLRTYAHENPVPEGKLTLESHALTTRPSSL